MRPNKTRWAIALFAVCALLAPGVSAEELRVTVLEFDAPTAADEGRAAAFFGTLRTQVAYHPTLTLNDVPPQRLDDLLLAIGCYALDEACAAQLADIVGGDILVFGVIHDDEGSALEYFDMRSGTTSHRAEVAPGQWPRTPEGESVLARGVLWGPVGVLRVTSDPPGATVYFGDTELGETPLEASALPLRRSEVRVELEGYTSARRDVAVDIEPTAENFTLAVAVAADVTAAPSRQRERSNRAPSRTLPVVVATAGGLLTGAGVATSALFANAQRDFDAETASLEFDAERALRLRDEGERYATLTNVLLPLGATALIGGTTWALLRRRTAGADAQVAFVGDGFSVRW